MTMLYVERAADGTIKGLYRQPQAGYAEEALAADHADVAAFEARTSAPRRVVPMKAWKQRLTASEKVALGRLLAQIGSLSDADAGLLFDFLTATDIDYDDPKYEAGLGRLRALGVLSTDDRRTALLQPA